MGACDKICRRRPHPARPSGFERDDAFLASLESGADASELPLDGEEDDAEDGGTWSTNSEEITERQKALQEVGRRGVSACGGGWGGGGAGRLSHGKGGGESQSGRGCLLGPGDTGGGALPPRGAASQGA